MSEDSAGVTSTKKDPHDVMKDQLNLLLQNHKRWNRDWEQWLLETKKNFPSYLKERGFLVLRLLMKAKVFCEVARRIVPECDGTECNELLMEILEDRLLTRCVKYKDQTYYSVNSQTDEYIELVIEQPDFDLMMIFDPEDCSENNIYVILNLICKLGEYNRLIRYMLENKLEVFTQRFYLKRDDIFCRHFFSKTLHAGDYFTQQVAISPCEMLVYFDHSPTKCSSVINAMIKHGVLTYKSRGIFGLPVIFYCLISKFNGTYRARDQAFSHLLSSAAPLQSTKLTFMERILKNRFGIVNMYILKAQFNIFMEHDVKFFLMRGDLPDEPYAKYMDLYHNIESKEREIFHKTSVLEFIKDVCTKLKSSIDTSKTDYHHIFDRTRILSLCFFMRLINRIEFAYERIRKGEIDSSKSDSELQLSKCNEPRVMTEEEAKVILKAVLYRFFLLYDEETSVDEAGAARGNSRPKH